MASTLNLFALDRDFPASRQLQIAVENNDEIGKKENRLLVTDNKVVKELQQIKDALLNLDTGDSSGGQAVVALPSTKVIYPTNNIFATLYQGSNPDKSQLVNVTNIDKINIYYSDARFNEEGVVEGHSIRVIGRLNYIEPYDEEGGIEFYTEYNDDFIGEEVELYRFFPKNNLSESEPKNKFNVIDLSVNGVSHIYLEISPENGDINTTEIIRESAVAFVSAQYLEQSSQAIGGTDGYITDINTVIEEKLNDLILNYNLKNNTIGINYNLFVQNNLVSLEGTIFDEEELLYDSLTRKTYYPIFSFWNSDSIEEKIFKINKIVINIDKSLIYDIIHEQGTEYNSDEAVQILLGGSFLEHINLKINIVNNTSQLNQSNENGAIVLNKTDLSSDYDESNIKFSNNTEELSTAGISKKPFTNIAFNSNEVTKEISFNDTPFVITSNQGLFVEGNSLLLPSVVNINVYFTEINTTDL